MTPLLSLLSNKQKEELIEQAQDGFAGNFSDWEFQEVLEDMLGFPVTFKDAANVAHQLFQCDAVGSYRESGQTSRKSEGPQ